MRRPSTSISSSRAGYPNAVRRRKRSSCASGSGYVPSYSIGFCVAMTRNGGSSTCVCALDRDLTLLHRLEQRRLRLRRGAVDLVGEEEVGEDRPVPELEVGVPLVPDRGARDVGGHQVGRELDALEAHAQHLRERARGERLRETRVVLEQHVPVREEAERGRARAGRACPRPRARPRRAPARTAPGLGSAPCSDALE